MSEVWTFDLSVHLCDLLLLVHLTGGLPTHKARLIGYTASMVQTPHIGPSWTERLEPLNSPPLIHIFPVGNVAISSTYRFLTTLRYMIDSEPF